MNDGTTGTISSETTPMGDGTFTYTISWSDKPDRAAEAAKEKAAAEKAEKERERIRKMRETWKADQQHHKFQRKRDNKGAGKYF